MQHLRIPSDEEYLNDFHKKWNEACMKANEQTASMHYSAEFARAQSQRMDALVKQEEEKLRASRKKR